MSSKKKNKNNIKVTIKIKSSKKKKKKNREREKRELAITILEIFDNFLDSKDITVPSDDDDDRGDDNTARIYGTDFAKLENDITNLLLNKKDRIKLG